MVIHGKRPRSIDASVPDDTVFHDVLQLFLNGGILENFIEKIEAIFQIGKNTFNITIKEDEDVELIKKQIIEYARNGIATQKGKIYLTHPKEPLTRLNIRAVPSELENDEIIKEINKFGSGTIKRIERIHHRNTKIHNGYRTIFIENYVERRIPPFIKLGEAFCKVFFPTTEYTNQCNRCFKTDHITKNCDREIVCMYCKQPGHVQIDCEKKNEDFPVMGKEKIHENLQMKIKKKKIQTEKLDDPLINREEGSPQKQTNDCTELENQETSKNIEKWVETEKITIEDSSASSQEDTLTESIEENEEPNLSNIFEKRIITPIEQRVMTPVKIIGKWGSKNIDANTNDTPFWSPSPIAGKRQTSNEGSPRKKMKSGEWTSDNEGQ